MMDNYGFYTGKSFDAYEFSGVIQMKMVRCSGCLHRRQSGLVLSGSLTAGRIHR